MVSLGFILINLAGILASYDSPTTSQFHHADQICTSLGKLFVTQKSKDLLAQRYPNLMWFCSQINKRNEFENDQAQVPKPRVRQSKCKMYNWKGFSLCSRHK